MSPLVTNSSSTAQLSAPTKTRDWLLVAIACVLFLAQELPLLHTRWGSDENFMAAPAYTLLTEGRIRLPIYVSDRRAQQVEKEIWGYPPGIFLVLQAPFRLFGFGVVQARSVTVLAGLGVIVLTFLLGRQLVGPAVGVLASFLVATDNLFWLAGRCIRPDMFVALFLLAGLIAYFHSRKTNSIWPAFAGGVAIGIAMIFHPNGMAAFGAIGILYLIECRWQTFREPRAWAYAFGAVAAIAPYLVWAHSTPLHAEAFKLAYSIGTKISLGKKLHYEIVGRYADFLQIPFRVHVALMIGIALGVLWFKNRQLFVWLTIVIGVFLLFWINAANKNVRPMVIVTPMFAIAVAAAAQAFDSKRLRVAGAVAAIALFGLTQMAGNFYLLYKDRGADYPALARQLREVIPPGESAYGAIEFFTALHDRQYFGYERTPFSYAIEHLKPTYMILNDRVMAKGTSGLAGEPATHVVRLREDAYAFVREHGELVARLPYPFYGDLEVYRVRYPQ